MFTSPEQPYAEKKPEFAAPDLQVEQRTEGYAESRHLHPILGSLIGARVIETEPKTLDVHEKLIELETTHRAADFIQDWYSPPNSYSAREGSWAS